MASVTSATAGRKLGLIERYSVARHNVGLFLNLVVGVKYHLEGAEADVTARFASGLAGCLAKHPFLSCVLLDDETNEPRWGRLQEVDPKRLIRWRKQSERLDEVLAELHSTPFATEDKTLPLWYLVLLPLPKNQVYALFVCHHAFTDGRGALAFHTALQEAMQGSSTTEKTVSEAPLPRPMEELVSCRPGMVKLLTTVLVELLLPVWISTSLGLRRPHFSGKPVPLLENRASETSVRSLRIDAAMLRRLIAVSREEHTSITAMLWAALASAISQTLTGDVPTSKGHIALDQRPACKPAVERGVIANYNAGFQLIAPPVFSIQQDKPRGPHTAAELFDLSRFVYKHLRHPRMLQDAAGTVGLLNYIPSKPKDALSSYRYDDDWSRFFRKQGMSGLNRSGTFAVSNLGVYKPTAPMGIEEALFSQSVGAIASLVVLSTVTCNDVLICIFTWQKGALTDAEMDGISSHFLAALESLAS